ncbi:MAG: cytochrome [Actinomycetia bacterium]|nr:cytochrome [Actinomycetes bacterium]
MAVTDDTVLARDYPFSPPHRLDVDELYARLRAEQPVIRVQLPYGERAWLATRYADVRTVLGDPRFSRAASIGRDVPRTNPYQPELGILAMDEPEHGRLRRLATKAFTARRIEALRPRTEQIAAELLDAMAATGQPADLVEHFATPLPIRVICDLLGVPASDQDKFHVWSEAVVSTTSLTPERISEYIGNLHAYIGALLADRRREPASDLLTAMAQARDADPDGPSEDELVAFSAGLLAAGHETTVTQIPNFLYALLTNPGAMERLRGDPALIPSAVEELLRWVPLGAASTFARYALEDVELSGVTVRAGEPVVGSLTSANRDERVFADPDTLDLARHPNPHIGFGHGVHHCAGAQLARMELQVALGALIRRFPGLRLGAGEDELVWKSGMLVRGLTSMPVAW